MVTRTFTCSIVKFIAFNEKTSKGAEKVIELMGTYKNDNLLLTAVREAYKGPEMPIKILSHKSVSRLMGMKEADFFNAAVELENQNTNKIKEVKTKTQSKRKTR